MLVFLVQTIWPLMIKAIYTPLKSQLRRLEKLIKMEMYQQLPRGQEGQVLPPTTGDLDGVPEEATNEDIDNAPA